MIDFYNMLGFGRNSLRDAQGAARRSAEQGVARTIGAASARGGVNPLAVARGVSQGQESQRTALAGQFAAQRAAQDAAQGQAISGAVNTGLEALAGGLPMLAGGAGGGQPQQQNPMGALGGLLSDENAKEDIRMASQAMDDFLGSIDPQMFRYNQGPDAGQERAGVMAQDLEGSEVGRTMVTRDEQTGMRQIDPQAALSALLAAQARINQRLEGLEGGAPAAARPPGTDSHVLSMPQATPGSPRPDLPSTGYQAPPAPEGPSSRNRLPGMDPHVIQVPRATQGAPRPDLPGSKPGDLPKRLDAGVSEGVRRLREDGARQGSAAAPPAPGPGAPGDAGRMRYLPPELLAPPAPPRLPFLPPPLLPAPLDHRVDEEEEFDL